MQFLIIPFYLIVSCIILIYSYGFLDFNLTLSSHPLFLQFVAPLQHLVYFQRPQSARIFVIVFGILFLLYILLLYRNKKLSSFPWLPFLAMVTILALAYPMLSYDIYNYMFHAKILWFYQANPHLHAPLEFQGDLWLRFMRWVHTPSAYGPVMTAVESPAYLLGFGKFVPVLYLMKFTISGFFVWCVYLVGKIANQLGESKERAVLVQLALAFNPFLLLELVVNGHNDGIMIALFLWALSLSLQHLSQLKSYMALALSVGVKFMTALSFPMYFIKNLQYKIIFSTIILLLPVLVSPGRFQPWYLTWSLIPAVLINHPYAKAWIFLSSLAATYFYVPYIETGFWNNTTIFVYSILYLPLLMSAKWALQDRHL